MKQVWDSETIDCMIEAIDKLEAEKSELLEALEVVAEYLKEDGRGQGVFNICTSAIAKAKGA